MDSSIQTGIETKGILDGGLNVELRAPSLFEELSTTLKRKVFSKNYWSMPFIFFIIESNSRYESNLTLISLKVAYINPTSKGPGPWVAAPLGNKMAIFFSQPPLLNLSLIHI